MRINKKSLYLLLSVMVVCLICFGVSSFYAEPRTVDTYDMSEDDGIVFDLAKGDIIFNDDTYKGYDYNGSELTGKHLSNNKYIIKQSNSETSTSHTIKVGTNLTAVTKEFDIYLSGVNIKVTNNTGIPIYTNVNDTGKVYLILRDNTNNIVELDCRNSANIHAAIEKELDTNGLLLITCEKGYINYKNDKTKGHECNNESNCGELIAYGNRSKNEIVNPVYYSGAGIGSRGNVDGGRVDKDGTMSITSYLDNLTIAGGKITAKGAIGNESLSGGGAGIGVGCSVNPSNNETSAGIKNFNITGGYIDALAGDNSAACIGGGYRSNEIQINIYGGTINATSRVKSSNQIRGAGIGAGGGGTNSGSPSIATIKIYGGTIVASSQYGAGIGGAGGGDGLSSTYNPNCQPAYVYIYGGNIKTISTGIGAGIGSGGPLGNTTKGSAGKAIIEINGGIINAISELGADIGGGGVTSTSNQSNGGIADVSIKGGIVVTENGGIGGGKANAGAGGSATIEISGGTIKTTNVGGGFSTKQGYSIADVKITGGSINASVSTQPTNGSKNVYLTRATLYSKDVAMTNQSISSLKGTGLTTNYGLNEVKTDENGMLYLWCPSGSVITGANDGTDEYEGSVASKTVGILQYNSSKQYYATKISYNRDVTLYTDQDLKSEFSGSLMSPSNTNTSFWIKTNTYDTDKYYSVNVYMSDGTEMKKIEPIESDTSNGIYKYTINITSDNYMWIETQENNSNKRLSIDLSLGNAVIEDKKITINGYTLNNYDGDYYLTSAGLGVTNNFVLKKGNATITTNSLVVSSKTSGILVEDGELNLYSSTSNDSITSTDESAVKVSKGANFNMYDTLNGSIELKTTKAETSAIGGSGNVMISKNGGFMTLTQGENATDITAENYTFVAQKQLSNVELPYDVTLVGKTFVGYSSLYKDGSTTKMYSQTDKHTTTDKNEEFKAIGVEYINYGNETIVPTIKNNNVEFAVSGIASGKVLTAHIQNGNTLLENDTNYTWAQDGTTGTLIVNGNAINEHLVVAVIEADELAIVVDAVDQTFEYDNTPHSIDVRVVFPTTGVKIEYSTDSKSLNADGSKNESANWSETKPEFNTVGTHNVYWVASAEHYNNKTGSNKITITKATNYFTSGGVMIESINKGGTLNPNATSKYGTPYYEYSSSYNGTYSTKEPTEAGIYYVRAVVDGTNEYEKIVSEPVAFFIEDPTIYVLGKCSWEKINTIGALKAQTATISKDKEVSTLMNFSYAPDKANSNYITFEFSESPSIGTTLTLIDFSDTENTYIYYYPVKDKITKVSSNEFMKIGTTTQETFEKAEDGDMANVLYQLNIKYKDMPTTTSTLKMTKQTGSADMTLMAPVTLKTGNTTIGGSIAEPNVTMSENNHKVNISTKISGLITLDNYTNVLTLSLFENDGTTPKVFSDNAVIEINGKQSNINGSLATIGDIENGNIEISINGLKAENYKAKIGLANVRNEVNNIKFPMKSRIENVSKEIEFTIAEYPSFAIRAETEKIEDRVVNTTEESKTINLTLKYKATNTTETPNISMSVKRKGNDLNYNVPVNNWTYTLSNPIKDTTNSTDKIETTTMTLNITKGSQNDFYKVFITIGNKTTSLNIVVYDGELSEVIVGDNIN